MDHGLSARVATAWLRLAFGRYIFVLRTFATAPARGSGRAYRVLSTDKPTFVGGHYHVDDNEMYGLASGSEYSSFLIISII